MDQDPPATITSATRINLGILFTMIGASGGLAMFLMSINTKVAEGNIKLEQVTRSAARMEAAIDKIADQVTASDRELSVLKTQIMANDRERAALKTMLDAMELRLRALEKHD